MARDKTWDGRPQNPERDGLHYITDAVAYWEAGRQKWTLLARTRQEPPEWLAAQSWAEYRGPCPTLAEAEARVEAARREALEEAAEAAQKHAVSEGWSNTSALRFRNCIRALRARMESER